MNVGDKAADFSLKDGEGDIWKLSTQLGKVVVLLFYPGDDTPICTKQLCSVRDNWTQYQETGAVVVGISTDSHESHKKFAEKHTLTLRLLSDDKYEVISLYDVKSWLPNRSARATFVINKDGIITYKKTETISLFRPKDEDILDEIRKANS